jgi:hypothetical protein
MAIKEYNVTKNVQKTATENKLIVSDRDQKVLFDFSLLDQFNITDQEKELIKADAMKCISPAFKEQIYFFVINPFSGCNGIAYYCMHQVYNKKSWKRLYVIMQLTAIKHYHGDRQSIYDQCYKTTETTVKSDYFEPLTDYEIA